MAAHCYARQTTQADLRALQRPKICPTHGTEPPFPPFRCATEGSRGAKEGLGESRGGKGTIRCPCPLLPLSVGTDNPLAVGTGVLRNAVQQHLRKNKRVKSVRSGVYGEGEQGVTIVELK